MRPQSRRRLLLRTLKALAASFSLWIVLDFISTFHVSRPSAGPTGTDTISLSSNNESLFVSTIFWTSEPVLRSNWSDTILALAHLLGPNRIFISIHESGSLDGTKDALRELDAALEGARIPHRITLDEETRMDVAQQQPASQGWLQIPTRTTVPVEGGGELLVEKGKWVPRRIPYLAQLRNRALEPLWELEKKEGKRFSKVLFVNDVVFSINDLSTLLSTKEGSYAAACSLDFKHAHTLYDTFALRDTDGHAPLMLRWPYFRSRKSRDALLRYSAAVPVSSCWNGLVAMRAEPFYDPLRPLRIRSLPDGLAEMHVEASESCLIHADNPLSAERGVFVNPDVRVGYDITAYEAVHSSRGDTWLKMLERSAGKWENRAKRWVTVDWVKERRVRRRLRAWREKNKAENREVGEFCLIDEMQVLLQNGWIHA